MGDKIGTLIETTLYLIREERNKATRFGTMGYIYRLEAVKDELEKALEEWKKD